MIRRPYIAVTGVESTPTPVCDDCEVQCGLSCVALESYRLAWVVQMHASRSFIGFLHKTHALAMETFLSCVGMNPQLASQYSSGLSQYLLLHYRLVIGVMHLTSWSRECTSN